MPEPFPAGQRFIDGASHLFLKIILYLQHLFPTGNGAGMNPVPDGYVHEPGFQRTEARGKAWLMQILAASSHPCSMHLRYPSSRWRSDVRPAYLPVS